MTKPKHRNRLRYPWETGPSNPLAPAPDLPQPKIAAAPVERTAFSLPEAAASIGVSASTLAGLGPDGPPSFKLPRRNRRLYPIDGLRQWLARCAAEPADRAAEAEGGAE